jgi:glycosyltransferase involved in cell wall biosynthesis
MNRSSDHERERLNRQLGFSLPDVAPPANLLARIISALTHQFFRAALWIYSSLVSAAERIRRPRPLGPGPYDILLTGSFFSQNWILAHLLPLVASQACRRVRFVSCKPLPPIDKLDLIFPPRLLRAIAGDSVARMMTFLWVGLTDPADYVGGFHLLLNGLFALLISKLTGARSIYICGGGPREFAFGGVLSENRLFHYVKTPDLVIEQRLIQSVCKFDVLITMGNGAGEYLRHIGATGSIHNIPGGIDDRRFFPSSKLASTDFILVGRLVPVKRIDVFLEAISIVKRYVPGVHATIVGDGPLRAALEQQAAALGITENMSFAGSQTNVGDWLRAARAFVLTSDSEGIALSLMEALSCGLPAIVSDVGDLRELVEPGANGYLVRDRRPEVFADHMLELLTDQKKLAQLAYRARQTSSRLQIGNAARSWDEALTAHHAIPASPKVQSAPA